MTYHGTLYAFQNLSELWHVAPKTYQLVRDDTRITVASNTLRVTDILETTSELSFGMGQINGYGYSSDYREIKLI